MKPRARRDGEVRRTSPSLDVVSEALGKLGRRRPDPAAPPPVAPEAEVFGRIESKLFKQLGTPESAVPADAFEIDDTDIEDFFDSARLTGDIPGEVDLAGLAIPPASVANATSAEARTRRTSKIHFLFSLQALCLAVVIFAASVALVSRNSLPGDLTYPVNLQLEALRLAVAGGGLDRAEVLISIASDRLETLRGPDAPARSRVAALRLTVAELEAAAVESVDILEAQPSSVRRIELTGQLLGVTSSARRTLAAMSAGQGPAYSTSGLGGLLVLVQTKCMEILGIRWDPSSAATQGTYPDVASEPAGGSALSPKVSRVERSSNEAQSGAPGADASGPRVSSSGDPDSPEPTNPEGPEGPDGASDDCALAQGTICITFPQLPSL